MVRRWVVIGLGALWTGIIYGLAGISGTLTLGLLSHRLVNVWAYLWGRGLLKLGRVRLRVVGGEHLRERRSRVMVMNHAAFMDMAVLSALNPPAFTALVKKEFARNPIIGWGMWATGMHFVDRRDRARALKSMQSLAAKLRRAPRTVVVFPEGTRSRNGELQPFKTGAFHLARQTGASLVPVVIYGAYALNPPGTLLFRPGEVTVVVHPPRATGDWTDDDIHARAQALHDEYRQWLAAGPPPA